MTDLRRVYRHIVTAGADPSEDLPAATIGPATTGTVAEQVMAAADQLQAIFDQRPEVHALTVHIDGEEIGVATREDYPTDLTDPGTQNQDSPDHAGRRAGEGDHALLPGLSKRYQVFEYTCPDCGQTVYTTAATAPPCPSCRVHTT